MDDASLDEFVGASDDSDGDASDEAAADADSDGAGVGDEETEPAEESAADSDSIDPAAATYAWSRAGAVCAVCDDSVARRWRDGDELVCADCKEW